MRIMALVAVVCKSEGRDVHLVSDTYGIQLQAAHDYAQERKYGLTFS